MTDFIEVISIAKKRHYFSFKKKEDESPIKFSVTTLDNNDSINFEMGQNEFRKWKITTAVPTWIKNIEDKLGEAIRVRQDLKI